MLTLCPFALFYGVVVKSNIVCKLKKKSENVLKQKRNE
jgi:hypothetical protein